MQMNPNKDTQLCMSLSGRPGNFGLRFHNHLYEQLGLNFYYKAFSSQDLPGAIAGIRALGIRGCGDVAKSIRKRIIVGAVLLPPSLAHNFVARKTNRN
jgi:hypothetical protein